MRHCPQDRQLLLIIRSEGCMTRAARGGVPVQRHMVEGTWHQSSGTQRKATQGALEQSSCHILQQLGFPCERVAHWRDSFVAFPSGISS